MITLGGYSAAAPLLLVTDFPATGGGGGGVILRSLLGQVDRRCVVWASPSEAAPGGRQDVTLAPSSSLQRTLMRRRSVTVDALLAGRLAAEIEQLARARGARALWVVMHGPMVHVAARLLSRKTLPIHLTVHDDPAFGVALLSRRYLALLPLIERDVSFALRRADSVDVVSEGMAARYGRRYGVRAIVVHRGLSGPVNARAPHVADGVLDVGVMGNTYGYEQLPLLARAVERTAGARGLRPRVTLIGGGPGDRLSAAFPGLVDVTGHLDESAAVERLARCFVLYLNYPFSRRAAVLRQTSFPTKLSSYLLATRPLLAHAPRDSSIAELERSSGYAAWWGSEDVADGASTLGALWDAPAAHASAHVAAERLRLLHYDLEANQATLFRALEALAR